MSNFIIPYARLRPLDTNGLPMATCKLQFFLSTTTTPTPVYNAAGASLGVEIVADSAGMFPALYGDSAIVYRMILLKADGSLVSDDDPVNPQIAYPTGTIVMFYGTAVARDAAYPPALWALCDGTNGTPDSRDRSPLGVSATKPIATTGGSVGTLTTTSNGSHSHSGLTGSTTLSAANIPIHNHDLWVWNVNGSNPTGDGFGIPGFNVSISGELAAGGAYANANAFGTKLVRDAGTASPSGHNHSIGADGAHTHDVAGAQSPYFTTWFLMRK